MRSTGLKMLDMSPLILAFAATGIALCAMIGGVAMTENIAVLFHDKDRYAFDHPLTQWRLSNLMVGCAMFFGTMPDTLYILTLGEVSQRASEIIKAFTIAGDMISPLPMAIWGTIIILHRYQIRDSLSGAFKNPAYAYEWVGRKVDWQNALRRLLALIGLAVTIFVVVLTKGA